MWGVRVIVGEGVVNEVEGAEFGQQVGVSGGLWLQVGVRGGGGYKE